MALLAPVTSTTPRDQAQTPMVLPVFLISQRHAHGVDRQLQAAESTAHALTTWADPNAKASAHQVRVGDFLRMRNGAIVQIDDLRFSRMFSGCAVTPPGLADPAVYRVSDIAQRLPASHRNASHASRAPYGGRGVVCGTNRMEARLAVSGPPTCPHCLMVMAAYPPNQAAAMGARHVR